jgi:hypothetical protein
VPPEEVTVCEATVVFSPAVILMVRGGVWVGVGVEVAAGNAVGLALGFSVTCGVLVSEGELKGVGLAPEPPKLITPEKNSTGTSKIITRTATTAPMIARDFLGFGIGGGGGSGFCPLNRFLAKLAICIYNNSLLVFEAHLLHIRLSYALLITKQNLDSRLGFFFDCVDEQDDSLRIPTVT